MRISDWSSDVCSSDLAVLVRNAIFLLLQGRAIMVFRRFPDAGEIFPMRAGNDHQRSVQNGVGGEQDRHGKGAHLRHAVFHVPGFEIRMRSEEHTSELQSLMRTSYAVFCLKKKTQNRSL